MITPITGYNSAFEIKKLREYKNLKKGILKEFGQDVKNLEGTEGEIFLLNKNRKILLNYYYKIGFTAHLKGIEYMDLEKIIQNFKN